ncbi:MAG: glycosyltransferase family 2 protein [bacterium]
MKEPKGCVIIPAYREGGRIGAVVEAVRGFMPDVIVVDDGSPDETAIQAERAGAVVVRHVVNRGKGAALDTGFRAARERGFDLVITMDGDGQHSPADLPLFVHAYADTKTPVLVGTRMADTRTMPWVRRLTNQFMSWLLSRELGQWVPDTQCGYRLYELAVVPETSAASKRFAAESEILMDLSHKGVRIGSVPIATIYGTERSKIHPVKDTIRFIQMLRHYRKRRKNTGKQIPIFG